MSITRVGTAQAQSFVLEQINKSTASYVDIQQQISTGQKAQRFAGIADESAQTVNLANYYDTLSQYKKSADTANARLSAMGTSLEDIINIATKFRAQLIQGMTANQGATAQLGELSSGYLTQVSAALNTDLAGVHLFGGTINNQPPVDLTDPVDNTAGTYYTGADQLMTARIDQNTVLNYGTTADRQGFKDLVASLQGVMTGYNNLTSMETALDKLNTAIEDITNLQADIGHQMAVVETSKAHNDALQATTETQLSNLRDVDISAAMVDLSQRQTILQASYLVISRANDLSLTNYLR
jgi:flagellar hook-associated protein 3 FlgL